MTDCRDGIVFGVDGMAVDAATITMAIRRRLHLLRVSL